MGMLEQGASAFRTILLHLAGSNESSLRSTVSSGSAGQSQPLPMPCLIHCTAGKDRTGVIVAIILSLLGLDDEAISTEYSLTDIGLANVRELFVERLLQRDFIRQEYGRAGAQEMISAR